MVSAVPLSGLTPSESLKLGVVQATSVMRTLQIGDRPIDQRSWLKLWPSSGGSTKQFTLSPTSMTRPNRILNQLNQGENRHKLARAVFHGKQGELRQRYREGQEDQLSSLQLEICYGRSKRVL